MTHKLLLKMFFIIFYILYFSVSIAAPAGQAGIMTSCTSDYISVRLAAFIQIFFIRRTLHFEAKEISENQICNTFYQSLFFFLFLK